MRVGLWFFCCVVFLCWTCAAQADQAKDAKAGAITAHSRGLHGYIGFSATRPPSRSEYGAGMGFYSAVWPLIDQPLADFQIGLAGSWIMPDNSDNKDKPLAPEGTLARTWRDRGPTWSSVFQTVEGGLGYWAGNHFRYGPPKFSMNATPQCYDYEVGSPGWSFFYSNEALPDSRLSIAQLSNRLLIPPDALPFQGNPNGQFLGYTWMALPFTEASTADPPTGDQSWTCFLSAANFKGPIAYYIPESWSKIGKLFKYPFLYGRGLDARAAEMGGGAMEINTVPCFDAADAKGVVYSKIPKLQFPVDSRGRSLLVQDVTYYSRAALYDAFKAWREGGPACSGRFAPQGAWKSKLTTHTTRYDQAGKVIAGVERVFDTKVFDDNVWGLEWFKNDISPAGRFPQYFKLVGEKRVAVAVADVPAETRLPAQEFVLAPPGRAVYLAGQPAHGPGLGRKRTLYGQAGRRILGHVLVVSLCRSAVVPAVPLGRGEESQVAGPGEENPCHLADRPRLHAAARRRHAGDTRSGAAGDPAPRNGIGLRAHRDAPGKTTSGKRQTMNNIHAGRLDTGRLDRATIACYTCVGNKVLP